MTEATSLVHQWNKTVSDTISRGPTWGRSTASWAVADRACKACTTPSLRKCLAYRDWCLAMSSSAKRTAAMLVGPSCTASESKCESESESEVACGMEARFEAALPLFVRKCMTGARCWAETGIGGWSSEQLRRHCDQMWAASALHRSAECTPLHQRVRSYLCACMGRLYGHLHLHLLCQSLGSDLVADCTRLVLQDLVPCNPQQRPLASVLTQIAPDPVLARLPSNSCACPGLPKRCHPHAVYLGEAGLTVDASKEARKEDSGMSRSTLLSMSGVAK